MKHRKRCYVCHNEKIYYEEGTNKWVCNYCGTEFDEDEMGEAP